VITSVDAFARISNVPVLELTSEEDVKITIALPLLRALGYDDADVNDERRTGQGRIDMVIDRFPVGIVVETKSPRTQLTHEGITQLEAYVFDQHTHDRSATVAVLTNGEVFRLYGVIGDLRKGALQTQVLYSWKRSELGDLAWVSTIAELLAREPNEQGRIPRVITRRQEEMRRKEEQLHKVETEIQALTAERHHVDEQIQRLQSERTVIVTDLCRDSPRQGGPPRPEGWRSYAASPHILRLLGEQGAQSKSTAAQRQRLDEPLVGKVEGVSNQQAVSFALIKLKEAGMIDYVKRGGIIREVWLI
jgi:predicted type IV restriction endonuclease